MHEIGAGGGSLRHFCLWGCDGEDDLRHYVTCAELRRTAEQVQVSSAWPPLGLGSGLDPQAQRAALAVSSFCDVLYHELKHDDGWLEKRASLGDKDLP